MAEITNGYYDPSLHTEHAAIRHDIAVESARLGNLVGQEACAINKHVGDSRREQEAGFADIRYDVATRAGDIRREVADAHCKTNDIVRQEGQESVMVVKDARHDIIAAGGADADRIVDRTENARSVVTDRISELRGSVADRFFAVGRDLSEIRQGQATLSKDVELNSLKGMLEAQKNTQYLSDKIADDGEKTRNLINDLKYHDLNRGLIERQTELVNCEQDRRRYHDRWTDGRFDQFQAQFAGQWAQLQNQVQAFQSQLQETRQGMVNFGTMAGVGQSSTSNNVR